MASITATAAATQADVTVATIRTWCRRNVIAAVKVAGRWVIDTASLAHRIAIGAMRTRKQATPMIDLTATYTIDEGPRAGTTITPKVRVKQRATETLTVVTGLAPLLADRIDAIADLGSRLHTLEVLSGVSVVISDTEAAFSTGMISARDNGRVRTSYAGTRDLPVSVVLELGEQLRTQLAKH